MILLGYGLEHCYSDFSKLESQIGTIQTNCYTNFHMAHLHLILVISWFCSYWKTVVLVWDQWKMYWTHSTNIDKFYFDKWVEEKCDTFTFSCFAPQGHIALFTEPPNSGFQGLPGTTPESLQKVWMERSWNSLWSVFHCWFHGSWK